MFKSSDIAIIYEHPTWHEPLFQALENENVSVCKFDLKNATTNLSDLPDAKLYYNLVSPSAYQRGNQHAAIFSKVVCLMLESKGKRVLNGSKSNELEFSKTSQMTLLASIGVDYPKTIAFNSYEALIQRNDLSFPMILKPEQGGSGARMFLVESLKDLENLFRIQPDIWFPDHLLLLQEKLDYDPDFGIIRVEFVGKKMLYAMRVVTKGAFNLCPSVLCNPEDGGSGICNIPTSKDSKPEFFSYQEIPSEHLTKCYNVFSATPHDIGSVEYLITPNGRQVFYDINANSNLRPSVAAAWGFDPFLHVARYLKEQL